MERRKGPGDGKGTKFNQSSSTYLGTCGFVAVSILKVFCRWIGHEPWHDQRRGVSRMRAP